MDWGTIIANWQTFYGLANAIYQNLLGQTVIGPALAGAVDLVWGYLIMLAYLIFYPLIWVVQIIQSVVLTIIWPVINLINAIISVDGSLYGVIMIFSGTFPSPWIVGLVSVLSIVIGLRIYSMIPLIGKK